MGGPDSVSEMATNPMSKRCTKGEHTVIETEEVGLPNQPNTKYAPRFTYVA